MGLSVTACDTECIKICRWVTGGHDHLERWRLVSFGKEICLLDEGKGRVWQRVTGGS
jgi:hypothetical protein